MDAHASPGLVIIGGSYAGVNLAVAARDAGYQEPIRIVADGVDLPCHRPPLSKAYLTGATDPDTLPLRSPAFYADHQIDILLGTRAVELDLARRRVTTDQGILPYDRLAVTTGARARTIPVPGAQLAGVVTLRTVADAEGLRARVPEIETVVVIGGGFIGLELAATLCKLGKTVTILEGLERVLARVASPVLSAYVRELHCAHGVDVVCNAVVASIEGDGRHVTGVRTMDGGHYLAELVIVAVGAVVNDELLAPHGLSSPRGVPVDSRGRTANPDILAAGDCVYQYNEFAGEWRRLESVQNATDQGRSAGRNLAGAAEQHVAVPWFWSDQFDMKLQIVGLSSPADAHVIRGTMATGTFSVLHFKADELVAIDSVNSPSDHMIGRRILAGRPRIRPEEAADPDFDLRELQAR